MSVPIWHVRHQGPVLTALARATWESLRPGRAKDGGPYPTPGPVFEETVPPRSPDLVRDFVRHVGGDPAAYRDRLPPLLFPQWVFPALSRTLRDVPYDLTKILNAGSVIEIRAPLPAGEPLHVRACLESIDDDGRRVVFRQRVVTGTASAPEALVVEQSSILPPPRSKEAAGPPRRKERARVGDDLREVGRFRAGPRAGLDFAVLTGDFNPLHWVPPVARLMGHRAPILHGFSTLARAVECLNRGLWSGDAGRLRRLDVRFTRPLVLPADVGVYVGPDGALAVGDAPGGPAYLTGTFATRD